MGNDSPDLASTVFMDRSGRFGKLFLSQREFACVRLLQA